MSEQNKPLPAANKIKKPSVQNLKQKPEQDSPVESVRAIPSEVINKLMGLLQSNQLDEVVAQANKLPDDVKFYPDVSAIKGIALFSSGRHEEAVSNLKYAVNNSSKPNRWWLVYLGQALNALKKWSEAIPVLQRVRKDYPGEPMMLAEHCLGEALMYSSKKPTDEAISQAINCFQLAVDLDEKYPWAQIGLGLAYKIGGKYELAVEVFQKAIKLAPVEATSELVKVYIDQSKYDLARTAIQRVLVRDLKSAVLYDYLGLIEASSGNWSAASKAWDLAQSLAVSPSEAKEYAEYKMRADIELSCIKRDFDKAAEILSIWAADEKSVEDVEEYLSSKEIKKTINQKIKISTWILSPALDTLLVVRKLSEQLQQSEFSHFLLAEVAFRLGRWKESRDALFSLNSIKPLSADQNIKLGQVLEKCEEFDKAFSPYLKAWSSSQRNAELLNLLKIASKEDVSIISDSDIALLFDTATKVKADKKVTDLLHFVSIQLSPEQLKNAGKNIILLLHNLGAAIDQAEANRDWSKVLDWLESLDSVGLMNPLPDWLAIESIWLAVQLRNMAEETKQQAKSMSLEVKLFDPEDALLRLESFGFWPDVLKYDTSSPLIDPAWIKRQERQSRLKHGVSSLSYLLAQKLDSQISPNILFDINFYRNQYNPEVNGLPLIVHFFRHSNGYEKFSYNPNSYLDCDWYRKNYLKNNSHSNPLVHYLENYKNSIYRPCAFFDTEFVRATQGLKDSENPLAYYMEQLESIGTEFRFKGFSPSPEFDRAYYLEYNADLLPTVNGAALDPYAHYVMYGKNEGRQAHRWQKYNSFVRHHMLHLEPFNQDSPITESRLHFLKNGKAESAYFSGQRVLADQMAQKPLISVLVPIYQVKPRFLEEMIESVVNQTYQNWQLCLVDDTSKRYRAEIIELLEKYSKKDKRIVFKLRDENGHICRTTNDALGLAKGKYVALLDHDDLLSPDALYEMALAINHNPDIDIIYSDEDKVDEYGIYSDPYYKPDWSPHSIWARMYVCHLTLYRKSLVDSLGGFRVGYEGSQDYDLLLRASEKTKNIHHIPKVLYHWRSHAESTASASGGEVKNYAADAGVRAVEDALKRRGIPAEVTLFSATRTSPVVKPKVNGNPRVEIIIPSRNGADILSTCLISIFEKSTYQNFRVTIVDNGSTDDSFFKLISRWQKQEPDRIQVVRDERPFNFSSINNYAVTKTDGEFLLFLNNDIEVITENWIEGMLGYAQLEEVGCVGVKLLYPDDTIQHAGTVTGIGGIAGHAMKHQPRNAHGYFSNLEYVTNYSVVTAACLMISRKKFDAVDGYEEYLQVAFNDVDFCLKVRAQGLYNVYIPFVELYHYESKSRGYEDTPEKQERFENEIIFMRQRWGKSLDHDPNYSPWLTLHDETMSFRYH